MNEFARAVLAFALGVLVAPPREMPTVHAQKIILTDEDGVERVRISASRKASGVWVTDPNDPSRFVALYHSPADGPVVAVGAEPGKGNHLALTADKGGASVKVLVGERVEAVNAKTLVGR